jgi:hypothetical protein
MLVRRSMNEEGLFYDRKIKSGVVAIGPDDDDDWDEDDDWDDDDD